MQAKKGGFMRISLKVVICASILLVVGSLAFAGFAKPEDAIRYRQAVMTVLGQHFGNIVAVLQGQAPYDKDKLEHDAMVVRTMADLPWDAALDPGSYKGNTTLKPLVLKEKSKFMAIARRLESTTKKLAQTAKSGDLKAIGEQFGKVAENCKTCHSTFRKS
jgi:cytochrome c556